MKGRSIRQLDVDEAANLIEGIVYLQWIKTGGLILAGGAMIALVNAGHAKPRGVWLWPPTTVILWLPAYMLSLGVLRLALRRARQTNFGSITWAVACLRAAPVAALAVAGAVAILV